MKVRLTWLIIGALVALIGTKLLWPTKEIVVKEKVIYQTQYQIPTDLVFNLDNFNTYKACYASSIRFETKTNEDWLTVRAFDDCKSNTMNLQIGTSTNWRIYFAVAAVGAIGGAYLAWKYLK